MQEGVHALVHGGDVFFRSKIPLPVIQKTYEPLLPLLERGIQLFFVPGNHERSRLPATPLFHHQNFHLFDRPRSFQIEINGLKLNLGGFPNIRHHIHRDFPQYLNQVGFERGSDYLNVLCLHQSIENAVVGVQNYTFRKDRDVISLDQFPDYLDLVLSGHIHRQQLLSSKRGTPIIYAGSIERTSFAERLETKGFYILTLSKTEVNWEFRALPTRPMHEWSLPSHIREKQDLILAVQDHAATLPKDAIFRVRVGAVEQLGILKIADLRNELPGSMNIDLTPPKGTHRYTWSAYSD